MKGDVRCVEGRLMRHDPQFNDPDLETDVGECVECGGKGHNCVDCAAPHAEETWEDYAPYRSGFRQTEPSKSSSQSEPDPPSEIVTDIPF